MSVRRRALEDQIAALLQRVAERVARITQRMEHTRAELASLTGVHVVGRLALPFENETKI